MVILAINPGSTSTKVAIAYQGGIEKENLPWEFSRMPLAEQLTPRGEQIDQWLHNKGVQATKLTAVVGRGGLLKPLESGTYRVDKHMVSDALASKRGAHPSNLGPVLANRFQEELGIPAFIVDPVSVDEREPFAKVTGAAGMERDSFAHVLSIRASSRKAAAELDKPLEDTSFVVAHIGGGTSVASVKGGRIIDVNNANDEGPFSAERAGGVPFGELVRLCYETNADKDRLKRLLLKNSGLKGYLDTVDLREVEQRDDDQSKLVFSALAYQIAKEIGAYASVLQGKIDGIVLTGGMANSQRLVKKIGEQVGYLGRIFVFPGEEEMEALIAGARRVLNGEEQAKTYGEE